MSAVLESARAVESPLAAHLNLVDEQNPWLGLDSFDEETRQYFHGREEEIAELARRVQRKTLAILFGQSGLGKTSILRAGIVPRLRREGFCPVYVRIDYARESPAPSQQIKQAIFRATEGAGRWTKAGTAVPGESLWEFLHHRDDYLVDETGKPLTPLLIFDQFEEIFTLGQMDDFGRARAAEFIDDLADLVENRPPRALESMLDSEDSIVERFDFERADYRILIALREDYLAHLEGLKSAMPSITQNRMRLARMTGHQALAAVMKPGGKLVSDEVAESIVRFVAGGAELRNAEVEPSLLSLVCRELNNARISQGRAEISSDLLAGSHDSILNEFYDRALADQPPGVRQFIEDEMLTESGFRESLAEERVQRGFAAANALQSALPLLVNRRLLRIEERLDARRVELTHDVLCAVVKASRDARHEREAREAAERQLAAQRAREEATKRSLVRTRYVAAGCAVLAIAAVASAIFGWQSMKRAQDAEAQANATRGEAEKLVGYLLDDFYLELAPVGRLDVVADLSKRALDYYGGLPEVVRDAQTDRNRALAQVRYGLAAAFLAKHQESEKALSEAIATLTRLRQAGDASEATAIGLGLGYAAQARLMLFMNRAPEEMKAGEAGAEVLRPLMAQPNPTPRLRRAYGDAMTRHGFTKMRAGDEVEGAKILEVAREAYRGIDGLKLDDLNAAAAYAEASAWQVEALSRVDGRMSDAQRVGEEAAKVAAQVLERRPGHMGALRSHGLLVGMLGFFEGNQLHLRKSLEFAREGEKDWRTFVTLDPGNSLSWNNLAGSILDVASTLENLGDLSEGLAVYRACWDLVKSRRDIRANFAAAPTFAAVLESDLGIFRADYLKEQLAISEAALKTLPAGSFQREATSYFIKGRLREAAMIRGEYAQVVAGAREALPRLTTIKTENEGQQRNVNAAFAATHRQIAWASYNLRDFAVAESEMRRSLEYLGKNPVTSIQEKINLSEHRIQLAAAIARQGRQAEAKAMIEPEVRFQRELVAAGSDDANQKVLLALALLVDAYAGPGGRGRPQLEEAVRTIEKLPPQMHKRRSVTQLRGWIAEESKRS